MFIRAQAFIGFVLVTAFSLAAHANIPYSSAELANSTFYSVWLNDEGCTPPWVIEPIEFDSPGAGQYTLNLCDGSSESGSYSVLPSGVLTITYTGGQDYIRRITFESDLDGFRICDADTEAATLDCTEEELDQNLEFDDQANAEAFQSYRNQYTPYTLSEIQGNMLYSVLLDSKDCGPQWVLETWSFDLSGNYSLELCEGAGGGIETGTYALTSDGVLQITYTGGTEYLRRINYEAIIGGWRQCDANSELQTLACSEAELDSEFVFSDLNSAQLFLAEQNGLRIPVLPFWSFAVLLASLVCIGRKGFYKNL